MPSKMLAESGNFLGFSMQYPATHLYLSRELLYELVWSKPMRQLAKDYGISDRAMAKLCARKQVPVPPRGYWAKKNSGQNVTRPPLSVLVEKEKPKPEPKKQEVKKPAKKKTNLPGEDQEKKVKQVFRDHRRRLQNSISYIILIDDWRCDYRFGINPYFDPFRHYGDFRDALHREPFDEHKWIVFKGKFLAPPQLKDQEVEVNLMPNIHLNEAVRDERLHLYREKPPTSLGGMDKEKPVSRCYIHFPEEAMNTILEAAAANKINTPIALAPRM